MHACFSGKLKIVKYLGTKHSELINTVDENNNNGLHRASRQGNLEIVMYLIETLKMDPAVKGRYGRNSFINACNGGKLEIVKYLATKHPELINSVDKNNNNEWLRNFRNFRIVQATIRHNSSTAEFFEKFC